MNFLQIVSFFFLIFGGQSCRQRDTSKLKDDTDSSPSSILPPPIYWQSAESFEFQNSSRFAPRKKILKTLVRALYFATKAAKGYATDGWSPEELASLRIWSPADFQNLIIEIKRSENADFEVAIQEIFSQLSTFETQEVSAEWRLNYDLDTNNEFLRLKRMKNGEVDEVYNIDFSPSPPTPLHEVMTAFARQNKNSWRQIVGGVSGKHDGKDFGIVLSPRSIEEVQKVWTLRLVFPASDQKVTNDYSENLRLKDGRMVFPFDSIHRIETTLAEILEDSRDEIRPKLMKFWHLFKDLNFPEKSLFKNLKVGASIADYARRVVNDGFYKFDFDSRERNCEFYTANTSDHNPKLPSIQWRGLFKIEETNNDHRLYIKTLSGDSSVFWNSSGISLKKELFPSFGENDPMQLLTRVKFNSSSGYNSRFNAWMSDYAYTLQIPFSKFAVRMYVLPPHKKGVPELIVTYLEKWYYGDESLLKELIEVKKGVWFYQVGICKIDQQESPN